MTYKVFISSVQSEFADERRMLCDYIQRDALLSKFFVPFLFEDLPAENRSAERAYLSQAEACDVYLGLYGEKYGYEDAEGVSPTEREYDVAAGHQAYRLIYLKAVEARHPKETALIKKVEKDVVRRMFSDEVELKSAVYASLIRYLEEKEIIRLLPFDAALHPTAKLSDLDEEKIRLFVARAREKRKYKLDMNQGVEAILASLNLISDDGRLTNSALLLFAKNPQKFFRTSEVKCIQFYGTEVQKPVPFYQIYEGNVFELLDQAKAFVMTHIDARIGKHTAEDDAVVYELPDSAVHEALMNAIVHRDYTDNGSVQVMLFRDRLEITNPGQLPYGLTVDMLRHKHQSRPNNPTLAFPVYMAGYIEKVGTGTQDMVTDCVAAGLSEPEFVQNFDFTTTIWRKGYGPTSEKESTTSAGGQVSGQVGGQVGGQVIRLLEVIEDGEMSVTQVMDFLQIKSRRYVREEMVTIALEMELIEMIYPDSPQSPKQKYRLTEKGKALLNERISR